MTNSPKIKEISSSQFRAHLYRSADFRKFGECTLVGEVYIRDISNLPKKIWLGEIKFLNRIHCNSDVYHALKKSAQDRFIDHHFNSPELPILYRNL